jgi:DNA-binding transcriptional ArsR family regulator
MRLSKSAAVKTKAPPGDELCGVPCFKDDLVTRLRSSLPADEALDAARVMFAALADRTRLKILHALHDGEELCVCDVAHVLGMSVSATSHHLRKLHDLKILTYRNDGKMAYYSLRDRFVAALARQALHQALS